MAAIMAELRRMATLVGLLMAAAASARPASGQESGPLSCPVAGHGALSVEVPAVLRATCADTSGRVGALLKLESLDGDGMSGLAA